MFRAMRSAASGMQAQQINVDTIANNIANVNTGGFKRNRLNFRSLLYSTMREPGAATTQNQVNPTGLQVGSGVEVSSSVKLHGQGNLEISDNPLDVAIQGEGFFQVALASGDVRYTRDGGFRTDAAGSLVTVDGFRVQPEITIPSGAETIVIGQDGSVQVKVATSDTLQAAGQLAIHRFPNPAGLRAEGQNFFSETGSSGAPTQSVPGINGAGTLRQGFIERSNVSVVDELINLIQAQRNYEVNSRTIQVADEMLQQVSNLI